MNKTYVKQAPGLYERNVMIYFHLRHLESRKIHKKNAKFIIEHKIRNVGVDIFYNAKIPISEYKIDHNPY